MIPAINDQPSDPRPIETAVPADVDADFVNGIYDVSGSPAVVGDITDYDTDRIIANVGLVGFINLYDTVGEANEPNPPAELLNDAQTIMLSGNFTMAIEWHNYRGNFAKLFHVSDAGNTSAHRFIAYDYPNNYFWLFDWLNPGSDNRERDITKGGDTPEYLQPGLHCAAITRTDEYLSISIDGDIVKRVTADQHSFASMGLTNAFLGGGPVAMEGDIIVGRLRLWATPLADAYLPGLADEITVMSKPANDAFANAQVIEDDEILEGRTFCATDEDLTAEPSVWYKFTAPATDDYPIALVSPDGPIIGGAHFEGWRFNVYSGGPAYDDLVLVEEVFSDPWPTMPSYTLSAVADTTYWFKVFGDNSGEGLFSVVVGTPPDETPPTITSSNTVNVNENATLSHLLTADESVTWSIVGGADAGDFEISGSTLRWLSNGTKDFEAPDDSDADNDYIVTVRATDLASNTTDQTITVTVDDLASEWVTIYDATTGTVSGDVSCGGTNTRLFIDAASTTGGSNTKIRVTFKAAAGADLNIDNAAVGKAGGSVPLINWSGTPTVLLFSGSAGANVPAGTELTSDEATVAMSFTTSDHLLVAINHGASSQVCGRAESGCVMYGKTMAGDDTTNASITTGPGQYGTFGSSGNSYGVSKIEVSP